jgi:hypothetical protein
MAQAFPSATGCVRHESVPAGFLWKEGACLLLLIWLPFLDLVISPIFLVSLAAAIGQIAYLGLAVWALLGPRHAVQALTASAILSGLNPAFFPELPEGTVLRWIVLAAAVVRVHGENILRRGNLPWSVLFLFLFGSAALVLSTMVSYEPGVSAFKLAAFVAGASSILLACRHTADQSAYWHQWFFTVFVVVLISSLPLLPTDAGYTLNGYGFQGILNQPQAYGVFMAPLVTLAASRWLASGGRAHFSGGAAALGAVTVMASAARTAASALILGLLITLAIALVFRQDWLSDLGRLFRSKAGAAASAAAILLLVCNAGSIGDAASRFFAKGREWMPSGTRGILYAFEETRGSYVQASWTNFLEHPFTGIGFGVASDPTSFAVQRDPILGLPIGAPVEKGFIATAVLEENGLVGAVLLFLLLGSLALPIVRKGRFHLSWLFWTSLILNGGEMVFFSMGGLGTHLWLLMAFATLCAGNSKPVAERL